MSKTFKADEVASHKTADSLWIIVDDEVYDVTKFADEHPGGKKILQRVGGKDASKQFWKYHNEGILKKYKPKLLLGAIEGSAKASAAPAPAAAAAPKPVLPKPTPKPAAAAAPAGEKKKSEALEQFGSMVPYGDPAWYQGYHSPYYNETHAALRAEVRQWIEEKVEPYVTEWDEAKRVPEEIYQDMGKRGWLAGLVGAGYQAKYAKYQCASVKPEQWDAFHELVLTDEISRTGSGGFVWNVIGGFGIGLPPVIKAATQSVKDRVIPAVINGEKRICLAITEPDAGSDVAGLTTTAVKTPDGKHYIVNGEKKWITNGIWADFFTVAVRTGPEGSGMNGVSVLLIEKTMPGVTTRKMDCSGIWSSGTTYITFEDVKVPVENLIGKENQGFKVIMTNFNHERLGIVIQCNRFARVCYEEAYKYANKRKTFGKTLISHPVIRLKLANMARKIEGTHNWLENITFQAEGMAEQEAMFRLGGAIAALKLDATQTFEFCAREAVQIFGGLGYTRGGQGAKVERLYREVRGYAIPGGSEEIMADLSIRQAHKVHKALGMKL
ncbi:putative acyl-CoA dehydrogenase [Ascobolus immersus RN42]|uniref:Putative acyl-CoA dehydrogenase n=1 Tax=Ascobolus immersus RN42 TaxID=1160509 RepID=A0A3N4HQL9_ASCIM|nr:putative acyl-CoA dehydrogenase [Ascobolus immersus RN42]